MRCFIKPGAFEMSGMRCCPHKGMKCFGVFVASYAALSAELLSPEGYEMFPVTDPYKKAKLKRVAVPIGV